MDNISLWKSVYWLPKVTIFNFVAASNFFLIHAAFKSCYWVVFEYLFEIIFDIQYTFFL